MNVFALNIVIDITFMILGVANVSWITRITIELVLLDDEHNLCGIFENIFDGHADVFVVFLRLLCTKKKKKNDAKRSNKNNHLRDFNAKC